MNDLERAAAILVCIKHTYPAVFRAFELDKVLEHMLAHNAKQENEKSPNERGYELA